MTRSAVIVVRSYSDEGQSFLKQIMRRLNGILKVDAVSSIYKVQCEFERSSHPHDLRAVQIFEGLVVAVRGVFSAAAIDLKRRLDQAQSALESQSTHCSVSFRVVLFGDETLMLGDLTLPDPELHLRADLVIPAAEVAGPWIHPVFKTSVKQLAQKCAVRPWGEFVGQGQSLLDFSRNDQ